MALPHSSRPLTSGFALAYAYDPAFDSEQAGYGEAYRRCLETLDFAPITKPGQSPTLFHFRPLAMHEVREIYAMAPGLAAWVAFRLSLTAVTDGGPELAKLEKTVDSRVAGLGKMLSLKQTEMIEMISAELGRIAGEIVTDLGGAVIARTAAPRPLS